MKLAEFFKRNVAKFFTLYAIVVLGELLLIGFKFFHAPARPHYLPYLDPMPPLVFSDIPASELGLVQSQYRGDEMRSGRAMNPIAGINLKEIWRIRGFNLGVHTASKASPAVDATGVYVGSDASWFYKYKLSGELAWRFFVKNSLNGVHSTAVLDEKFVYFGAYDGWIYALAKESGELIWQLKVGDAIGSSPTLVGDSIYVGVETLNPTNGYLVKVDRRSGRLLWKSPYLNEHPHSSPAVDRGTHTAFMGNNRGFVYAFNTDTGAIRWATFIGGPIKGSLLFHQGYLYGTSWNKTAFSLRADSGATAWRSMIGEWGQSSPVAFVNRKQTLKIILAADKFIYGLNGNSGAILWEKNAGYGRMGMSSPILSRTTTGVDLLWTACGEMEICALVPENGKEIMRQSVGGFLSAEPVIFSQSLFLALDGPSGDLVRYDFY